MIRFSLLLTCSLLTSTLVGEHTAFAMDQNDNDNVPQGIVPAPTPINWELWGAAPIDWNFWGAVSNFYGIHSENKQRSE